MYSTVKKVSFLIFSIVFFAACTHQQNSASDPVEKLFESLFQDKAGLIRGLELSTSLKNVKIKEPSGLTEDDTDYLFYEFIVDSSSSYTLAYSFENDSLNEIRADIYLKDAQQATELSAKCKEYLNKNYGEGQGDKDVMWEWQTKTENSGKIKIELSDESADYNYGKLSVTFYRNTDAEESL